MSISRSACAQARCPRPTSPRPRRAAIGSTRIAVGLELRRAGLRVGGVDRQHVRLHLVGEVQRHEREARAAATRSMRTGATTLPRADDTRTRSPSVTPSSVGVGGRQLELLAAAQRRRVAAGLHAGVERVQPPAGRQAQRELRPRAPRSAGRPRPRGTRPAGPRRGSFHRRPCRNDGSSSSSVKHGHWMPPSSSRRS